MCGVLIKNFAFVKVIGHISSFSASLHSGESMDTSYGMEFHLRGAATPPSHFTQRKLGGRRRCRPLGLPSESLTRLVNQ